MSRRRDSSRDMTPQLCVPGVTAVVRHVARTSRRCEGGQLIMDGQLMPGEPVIVNDVFSLPGKQGLLAVTVTATDGSIHIVLARKLRFERSSLQQRDTPDTSSSVDD